MRVLIVTTMRNEAPFLLEWIAHHRAAGVTDFLVYSNDCADGTDRMLDRLDREGVVVHRPRLAAGERSVQWQALADASDHPLRRAADWIAVLDCDEFLNLRAPLATIPELIAAAGPADAIALRWRLFGHDGRVAFTDAPVTGQFLSAAPDPCPYPLPASFFKTLFRACRFDGLGVHRPRAATAPEARRWVDGGGRALPPGLAAAQGRIHLWGLPTGTGLVQLNHYAVRAAESFMIKRDRGLPNHRGRAVDLDYWVERNFNSVRDDSIARMAPATAAEAARLRALPGLADLHAAGVAWHRARFRTLMRRPDEARLFGRLLLAGGSATLSAAAAHRVLAAMTAAVRDDGAGT